MMNTISSLWAGLPEFFAMPSWAVLLEKIIAATNTRMANPRCPRSLSTLDGGSCYGGEVRVGWRS